MTRSITTFVLVATLMLTVLVVLTRGPSVETSPARLQWTSASSLSGYKQWESLCGVTVSFALEPRTAPVRIDRSGESISLAPIISVATALEGDTFLAAGDAYEPEAGVHVVASFDRCQTFERLGRLPTPQPGMHVASLSARGDELRIELADVGRTSAPDEFVWKPLRGLPWPLHRRGGAFVSHDRGRTWSME